jgi:hypothetical protein
VLYEQSEVRNKREDGEINELLLEHLNMLFLGADGKSKDTAFDNSIFQNYDIVALSVMSPQASDAYLISQLINELYPHITTVIGGSHPRYYQTQVKSLPESVAFDFIVPQDGWVPMYKIKGHRFWQGFYLGLVVTRMRSSNNGGNVRIQFIN